MAATVIAMGAAIVRGHRPTEVPPSYPWLSFDSDAAGRAFVGTEVSSDDDRTRQYDASLALKEAYDRYPVAAMNRWIKRVYVVRRLSYDGQTMGGTNDPVGRNLVIETETDEVDQRWTQGSFHHELAHLLKDASAASFPERRWRSANAKDFRYSEEVGQGDGLEALAQHRDSEELDDGLNSKGLLCEYASSSIDEDWACTAQRIMQGDSDYWNQVAKYPRLRDKAKIAVAFYRKAMPGIVIEGLPKGW